MFSTVPTTSEYFRLGGQAGFPETRLGEFRDQVTPIFFRLFFFTYHSCQARFLPNAQFSVEKTARGYQCVITSQWITSASRLPFPRETVIRSSKWFVWLWLRIVQPPPRITQLNLCQWLCSTGKIYLSFIGNKQRDDRSVRRTRRNSTACDWPVTRSLPSPWYTVELRSNSFFVLVHINPLVWCSILPLAAIRYIGPANRSLWFLKHATLLPFPFKAYVCLGNGALCRRTLRQLLNKIQGEYLCLG